MNLPCYLTLYALCVLVFLQRESAHSHIIKHTHMHTQIIFFHFCQRKCILLVPANQSFTQWNIWQSSLNIISSWYKRHRNEFHNHSHATEYFRPQQARERGPNAAHIHRSGRNAFPNGTHSHSTQHRQSIAWQSETHAEMELISHFLLACLYLQCKINLTLIWARRGRVERWGTGPRWRAANDARVQIRCVAQLCFLVSPVLERKPLCSATLF